MMQTNHVVSIVYKVAYIFTLWLVTSTTKKARHNKPGFHKEGLLLHQLRHNHGFFAGSGAVFPGYEQACRGSYGGGVAGGAIGGSQVTYPAGRGSADGFQANALAETRGCIIRGGFHRERFVPKPLELPILSYHYQN